MFWIALMGLIVNITTALILKEASHEDINVRSAFLHMLGDTLSSVGVVLGAAAIYYKGWTIIDPLLSIMLCIPILIWSYHLIMESVDVLLEATPKHINISDVEEALMELQKVETAHDIHIWTLTSGVYAMSSHIGVEDLHISETTLLLDEINKILKKRFNIDHITIQFECVGECLSACS
jgi:cobalt-zinc-cadmium efflux system protein